VFFVFPDQKRRGVIKKKKKWSVWGGGGGGGGGGVSRSFGGTFKKGLFSRFATSTPVLSVRDSSPGVGILIITETQRESN